MAVTIEPGIFRRVAAGCTLRPGPPRAGCRVLARVGVGAGRPAAVRGAATVAPCLTCVAALTCAPCVICCCKPFEAGAFSTP